MAENISSGILVVWTDVIAEHETEFNSWYNEQHLPERLAVPGILNARRYVGTTSPKYLAYYEAQTPEVMNSDYYAERLANPTEWTQRVMPWFIDTVRSICKVKANFGHGVGGVVQTLTFSIGQAERGSPRLATGLGPEPLPDWLAGQALPEAASHLGCVRVQLWHTDSSITNRPSPEQAMRPQRDRAADWVIIVEAVAESALQEIIPSLSKQLSEHGAADIRVQGPYKLINFLRKE